MDWKAPNAKSQTQTARRRRERFELELKTVLGSVQFKHPAYVNIERRCRVSSRVAAPLKLPDSLNR